MERAIKIVIEMPTGKEKVEIVKSVDEAFKVCRDYGGANWKPVSYRPNMHRAGC